LGENADAEPSPAQPRGYEYHVLHQVNIARMQRATSPRSNVCLSELKNKKQTSIAKPVRRQPLSTACAPMSSRSSTAAAAVTRGFTATCACCACLTPPTILAAARHTPPRSPSDRLVLHRMAVVVELHPPRLQQAALPLLHLLLLLLPRLLLLLLHLRRPRMHLQRVGGVLWRAS